ncbi:MAG: hypothetical protein R6V56_05265 [Lentisphaeria bacterium]
MEEAQKKSPRMAWLAARGLDSLTIYQVFAGARTPVPLLPPTPPPEGQGQQPQTDQGNTRWLGDGGYSETFKSGTRISSHMSECNFGVCGDTAHTGCSEIKDVHCGYFIHGKRKEAYGTIAFKGPIVSRDGVPNGDVIHPCRRFKLEL